jgi:hypothetical protein
MPKDVFIEVQERSKFSLDNLPAGLLPHHKYFIYKIALQNFNEGFKRGLEHNLKKEEVIIKHK